MIGEKIFAHTLSVLSIRLRVGLFAIALLFLLAATSNASWQIVYRSPVGNGFRACYFFSEKVGLIAGNLNDGVYKTTNGGQSWSPTKFPRYGDGSTPSGLVTQILMTSPAIGWLTCEPITDSLHPALPGLYKTTNGGVSWVPVLNGHFSDVYQTSTTLVITGRDEAATGYISTDGGVSFTPAIPKTNGVDFVDNNYGVVVAYKQQIWSRTLDGGRTWLSLSATDDIESWSVYAQQGTPNFYTAGEGYPAVQGAIPSSIRKSTDYGATWQKVSNLQFRTTGHIAGFGSTLFVQVCSTDPIDNGFSGIYRSTDGGLAWFPLGGPGNENDTRFAVMGCKGEVIYAFDNAGNVWKTVDGGDGSIPQFQFPTASLKVYSIDVCSPQDTVIAIKNLGCDTIYIIDANAPALPPLDIFDATTGTTPSFPIIIPPNSSGKLRLSLHAAFSGVYQTRVTLAIMREGVFAFDTLTVTSAMKYYNPVRALTSKIQYDSLSLCESHDSTIRISNDSCFTVKIVSSQLKYGQNFVLDTGWTNDSIPPFSTKNFTVRFSPTQQGLNVDSLIVNLSVLGRPVRMSFPVAGTGVPDNPQLILKDQDGQTLANAIDFGTFTRCDNFPIRAYTLSEQGCDSLWVSVEWLDSTTKNPQSSSLFKWYAPSPRWVTKEMPPIPLGIQPQHAVFGPYQGYLRVSDSVKGAKTKQTMMIPYRITVVPGSRILGLDSSLRSFDTISYCQTHDTTILIKNYGCDTLHISQLLLSDPNFLFVPQPSLPINIKPYDSTSTLITVRYVPTVTGTSRGTVTIATDDTTATVRSIPLLGYANPTDTIKFKAIATNVAVHPGDTSTIEIKATGSFHAKGLNSIQVILEYNGDVMTPWNVFNVHTDLPGATTPTVGPMQPSGTKLQLLPINVSGNNISLDSNLDIARLQFLITLSDSGWTDFRVAQIILNNSDLKFNKCLLGAVTDSGTIDLKFYCGDSLLYKELREGSNFSLNDGIAPARGSAHPNPVTEGASLSIPYHATRNVTVKLQIIDATGAEVYSSTDNAKGAGDKTMIVPATAIRSGAYHYRLQPIDGGRGIVTGDFVVVR